MRALSSILFGTMFIASLGAATIAYAGDDAVIGTGLGAAIGGVLGSQIGHGPEQLLSTGIGVGIGGMMGNAIGHDMDMESSPHYPSGGYSIISESPSTVYYPYAPNYVAPPAPPPTYIDQNAGTYCRPYSQEIRIDGQLQESYGTACLQQDGTWRIVQ
jgi:surface antigen